MMGANHDATRREQSRFAAGSVPWETVDEKPQSKPATDNKVDAVLDERGKRYGKFTDHAIIAQCLKSYADQCLRVRNKDLAADQQEALDMIFHKIARIINGDPDYADSWLDIAGYAKLVADRLEGIER